MVNAVLTTNCRQYSRVVCKRRCAAGTCAAISTRLYSYTRSARRQTSIMKLIDSHCHLHDSDFYDDETRERVYQEAIHAGVAMILRWYGYAQHQHEAVAICRIAP